MDCCVEENLREWVVETLWMNTFVRDARFIRDPTEVLPLPHPTHEGNVSFCGYLFKSTDLSLFLASPHRNRHHQHRCRGRATPCDPGKRENSQLPRPHPRHLPSSSRWTRCQILRAVQFQPLPLEKIRVEASIRCYSRKSSTPRLPSQRNR